MRGRCLIAAPRSDAPRPTIAAARLVEQWTTSCGLSPDSGDEAFYALLPLKLATVMQRFFAVGASS